MRLITNLALVMSFVAVGVVTAGMFVGCSKKTDDGKTTARATDDALKDLPEKQRKALMELSAEDRKLALQQKTCPVTGEPLGSMGKPIKVDVKDQTVFVCCDGCVDTVKKEPEKYLAKLKK